MTRSCDGLGDFGVLKVERKRFVTPHSCRAGHLIAGENLAFHGGKIVCRTCRRLGRVRSYWAVEMRRYFAARAS